MREEENIVQLYERNSQKIKSDVVVYNLFLVFFEKLFM